MDQKLVASGVTQIAIGAASGWGLAALVGLPKVRERLDVDVARLRQAHLDVIIMGGLLTAAGAGVSSVPPWARRAAVLGAWTNPLLFVPLAVRRDAATTTAYQAASTASFTVTCAGWFGIARAARRATRR